jgi:lipid-A-disaccharide synthase
VGLPNILCQDFVVPEFLQDAATPQALSRAVLAWLDDAPKAQQLAARFTQLHHELMRDTPRLAADAIEKLLAR